MADMGQWDPLIFQVYPTSSDGSSVTWSPVGGDASTETAPSRRPFLPALPSSIVPGSQQPPNQSPLPPKPTVLQPISGRHPTNPQSIHHQRHRHRHRPHQFHDSDYWWTDQIPRPSTRPFRPRHRALLTRTQRPITASGLALDPTTTIHPIDSRTRLPARSKLLSADAAASCGR